MRDPDQTIKDQLRIAGSNPAFHVVTRWFMDNQSQSYKDLKKSKDNVVIHQKQGELEVLDSLISMLPRPIDKNL